MPVVRLSDEVFERLQRHAVPLVDSTSDVMARILDHYESSSGRPKLGQPAAPKVFRDFPSLWIEVGRQFNALGIKLPVRTSSEPNQNSWKQVTFGRRDIHYEWSVRKREQRFDVCLHFESSDLAK